MRQLCIWQRLHNRMLIFSNQSFLKPLQNWCVDVRSSETHHVKTYVPINMDTHMIVTVMIQYLWHGVHSFQPAHQLEDHFLSAVCGRLFNTFTAEIDHSRFNHSCLRLPASTIVDLIFPSRSFSFYQLRDLHYRRETCTAVTVYVADVIFIPFTVYYAYTAI